MRFNLPYIRREVSDNFPVKVLKRIYKEFSELTIREVTCLISLTVEDSTHIASRLQNLTKFFLLGFYDKPDANL